MEVFNNFHGYQLSCVCKCENFISGYIMSLLSEKKLYQWYSWPKYPKWSI